MNVLDGLDDLFDHKQDANVWLWRLLLATGAALKGPVWEARLGEAAQGVEVSFRGQEDPQTGYYHALEATDDLRILIANLDG